jgi:hypothetical protein
MNLAESESARKTELLMPILYLARSMVGSGRRTAGLGQARLFPPMAGSVKRCPMAAPGAAVSG